MWMLQSFLEGRTKVEGRRDLSGIKEGNGEKGGHDLVFVESVLYSLVSIAFSGSMGAVRWLVKNASESLPGVATGGLR